MDGSRKSDAAATRKRRSSILKSQRPPRTPFSELEFNVATPTDAKSRRVSFSRRNGVAEFEITEATTAWKNVYEEHNKSLESSVNESKGQNKPLVAHLGSRIASLQFEDAEAEIVNATGPSGQLVTSFDADRQECTTDDRSLSAPHRNFELSEFTNQQTDALFDDDANPMMREMTDQIDLNFSAFAPLAEFDQDSDGDKKDNMSYIGLDLNATHFSLKAEESAVSDMSITDTVHSSKVAASKIKSNGKNDWAVDKENIVVNPYVTPPPADNFAVADDCDDVLVFDGKKCKFQSDLKRNTPGPDNVPDQTAEKRRTIVYNDDAGDISVTQAVAAQVILTNQEPTSSSRKTIDTVYGNESNISMTQAIPSNLIISNRKDIVQDKQETIYFNGEVDMTVTEVVPAIDLGLKTEERSKTIVYQHDEGHVSVTEAVPANMIIPETAERRKTIVYQNEDGDISLTQAVPLNILQVSNQVTEMRKTIVYDADAAELEMTQAVPVNILGHNEKRRTLLFTNDDGNMSVTQAVPAHLVPLNDTNSDTRKSIICESNIGDIPSTLTKPLDISLDELQGNIKEIQQSILTDVTRLCSEAMLNNKNTTDTTSKRRTIVFNDDQGNVSITQALPVNILDPVPPVLSKKESIIYEGTAADISITQAVPIDVTNKSITLKIETAPDCSVSIPAVAEKSVDKTCLYEEEPMSPQTNANSNSIKVDDSVAASIHKEYLGRLSKSVTHANDNTISKDNMSNVINPIPAQMISIEDDLVEKPEIDKLDAAQNEMYTATSDFTVSSIQNVVVYEAAVKFDTTKVSKPIPVEAMSDQALKKPSKHDGSIETMDEEDSSSNSGESMVDNPDDALKEQVKENKKTIDQTVLNDLLDMSNASMDQEPATEDATKKDSNLSSENISVAKNASMESYLFITSGTDSTDVQSSKARNSAVTITSQTLESETKEQHSVVSEIKKSLAKLKSVMKIKRMSIKHESKNVESVAEREMSFKLEAASPPAQKEAANIADDTGALLDMLSHFTDTRRGSTDFTVEQETEAAPVEFSGHAAIEDQTEVKARPVPDRRSMVRSREDLLKDISMAQAMMRDAEDTLDESADSPEPPAPRSPARAAPASDVVKTLKFEDDDSFRREPESPLKKTAFGETTYMRDSKIKVIPEYLSYASDLKDLMDDLVKPMADALPAAARSPSTCSERVQASLLASSQIDLVPSCGSAHASPAARAPGLAPDSRAEAFAEGRARRTSEVVVFDHENPLNNVRLPPVGAGAEHGYEPRPSGLASPAPLEADAPPAPPAPASVERGVNAPCPRLKDSEANTLIAMKRNDELLDASSSLTLVDEPSPRPASPVRVLFELDDEPRDEPDDVSTAPAKKRVYSPARDVLHCRLAHDVTPKPASKVQRVSDGPRQRRPSPDEAEADKDAVSPNRVRRGSRAKTPETPTVTIMAALECKSEAEASDWRPELLHEMSSKDLVAERRSSTDVLAKIDMLPFMGTPECEWEARGADAWSLRLLRGRLRLALRLAPRQSAPRARVRADTPVLAARVTPVADHADADPIAALCVRFAGEAMQHAAARCARAGDAPALLRRCAGVARAAERWARAMHAARAHLAYTLTHDGALSLKVANVPLRAVWEVSMTLAARGDAAEAPRPLAGGVRVARVAAAAPARTDGAERALAAVPRDWGHAPRTVWRIFKYLKNKTRDDDLII